ncbi:MAG TPA: TlpA disulfide reductase family protein [Polyangia bacterium]|nr:TlpA disulfide reductase family protein [Polyangia bacterium]
MTGVLVPVLVAVLGAAPVQVGDAAPPLDGVPGTFAGNVTLVVFFATWCRPCHRAFPHLAEVQGQLDGRVRMVLVEAGEDPDEVRAFLAANAPPPGAVIGTDMSGETRRRWGIRSFPSFYVVDRDGLVQWTEHGFGEDSPALMLRALHAALGDPPPPRPGRRRKGAPRAAPSSPASPAHEFVKGVEILRGP